MIGWKKELIDNIIGGFCLIVSFFIGLLFWILILCQYYLINSFILLLAPFGFFTILMTLCIIGAFFE